VFPHRPLHRTRAAYQAARSAALIGVVLVPRRKYEFREEDKLRVLLWCGRHCCLCGRQVGVGIEVAHLDPHRPDIENAMPLCFNCHAATGHYNQAHPLGRRYKKEELRARRDQIYEQYTRHLVPPVIYTIAQGGGAFPMSAFSSPMGGIRIRSGSESRFK
jgi:hypothetical protein